MKKVVALFGLVALSACLMAEDAAAPKTPKEKASYAIGVSMGTNLKDVADDVDIAQVYNGIKDTVAGKPAMTEAEIRDVLTAFSKQVQPKMAAKQEEKQKKDAEMAKVSGEKNVKEGEAFLAENGKKEGVKTLPSGLQYKVIKEGDGEMPKPTDTVTTHYKGTLLDGSEFDSSYARNEPVSFPVKGVIPGWTEALQLMKVGSKWQLFIPSKLAYGPNGAGGKIGPNATLVFEVELLGIKK